MNQDIFNPQKTAGDKKKHSEDSIVKLLRQRFNQGYTYRLNNAFIYASDWECDFFCVNQEGYAFEFEIKISRSDFQSDFQKYKHMLFKKIDKSGLLMPNRFYYVVPDGMVSPDEIPKYAGLICVQQQHLVIVKRAPFIHKVKRDYRKILCDKFYDRYIAQRREMAMMKYDFTSVKNFILQNEKLFSNSSDWLWIKSVIDG